MPLVYKLLFLIEDTLLAVGYFVTTVLIFFFRTLTTVGQRLLIIIEHMLGLEINELLLRGIVLLPLLNIGVLFLLGIFYSFEDKVVEKYFFGVHSQTFISAIKFLIIFLAFTNLIFTLIVHNNVLLFSSYGLSYFQELVSFFSFGPIKNFSLLLDEFISFFVLLNSFVIFCCLFFVSFNNCYSLYYDVIRRAQLLFLTQFFANLAFMSSDMLGFYIFYEAILIPVFFF